MSLLSNETADVPIDVITLGKSQARQRDTQVNIDDDLVHSIRKNGLISPIVLKKTSDGKYELVAGQRRFHAHVILKKPTIKSYIIKEDIDDFDAKKISLSENTARKDMKKADMTDTITIFMDRYGSTKTVAEELGLSPSTIRKHLRLDRFPKSIQEKIKTDGISVDNAIKALDALGGDESTLDEDKFLETVNEMVQLPNNAKKKFVQIKQEKPDMSAKDAATKAKTHVFVNKITIEITDDQKSRIDVFKIFEIKISIKLMNKLFLWLVEAEPFHLPFLEIYLRPRWTCTT